jgi:hypothetical protein
MSCHVNVSSGSCSRAGLLRHCVLGILSGYLSSKRSTKSRKMTINEYDCVPACIACRQANVCPKANLAPPNETVRVSSRVWAPNRLEYIRLPCGCRNIPWPLWHVLGNNFYTITCDIHGDQKLSRSYKEDARREAAKRAKEASKPSGQLDLPPF